MVVDNNANFLNTRWLANCGAKAHVCNNAENLDSKHKFGSNDTATVGNGARLYIKHPGSSIVYPSYNQFFLDSVIHYNQAATNSLSIDKFYVDNKATFLLTCDAYYIQDN